VRTVDYKQGVGVVYVDLWRGREAAELKNEAVAQRKSLELEDVFLETQVLCVVG